MKTRALLVRETEDGPCILIGTVVIVALMGSDEWTTGWRLSSNVDINVNLL